MLLLATLLWQIGAPDDDYREFAIAGNYASYLKAFPHDVVFVVGRSDPKRDWPYVHPGPADLWAGGRSHRFNIVFHLERAPKGRCRLTVGLINTHHTLPPLFLVEVNGKKVGHIETPHGAGDEALVNPKAGRRYVFKCLFSGRLLKEGRNILTLTIARGSWALYDFLRLEGEVAVPKLDIGGFEVLPLPLYRKHEGKTERVALVRVDNWGLEGARAVLTGKVGEATFSLTLRVRPGQNRLYIPLPEVKRETSAEFSLEVGGRKFTRRVAVKPARRWLIFVVPTVHTDIGYTDFQHRVELRHAENTEKILDALPKFPSLVWTFETYWQLWCFLRHRAERGDELFQRLREGRLGLCALFGNMLTGLCSHEALNRVCLHAKGLAREYGFEVVSAILDDVPSAVVSLPMVLAGSGVRYLIQGVNRDRAPHAAKGLKNPFYWEGPDGSRVLCHIDPGYAEARGLMPDYETALGAIPRFVLRFERPDYPYDAILVNGAFGDNQPVALWFAEVAERWNREWAYPKIILSRPEDFFRHIEANFREKVPILRGDFGCWWEDGAASSALETALCRRAEERATCAEMLHSLASMISGAPYPKGEFEELWRAILLYDEHTWGAWCSVSQPRSEQTLKQWEVKASFARKADELSRKLLQRGLEKMAEALEAGQGEVLVLNLLPWGRTEVALLPSAPELPKPLVAFDLSEGKRSPCQPLPNGGFCFVAEGVPPTGYKRYRIETAEEEFPEAVKFIGEGMENEFFRLRIDERTGAIRSLLDKGSGRELVDRRAGFLLGEVIYVEGGEGTRAIRPDPNLPEPNFVPHRQEAKRIRRSQVGPVFGELTVEARCGAMLEIRIKIRLYRGVKRLDLVYEIGKEETLKKEAVYISFPLDLDISRGGLWLESPDAIVDPLRDQVEGACRDWYAVQRWVAASDGEFTALLSPLDTPLISLGGMNAGRWLTELRLERAHIFAYIMNNYWHTNYKASQGGKFAFRFSLTTWRGGFDPSRAVREGWCLFSPLLCAPGRGGEGRKESGSLVGIKPRGLALLTIKQAEDERGFVLRLWNPTKERKRVEVSLPVRPSKAWLCNLVEEPRGKIEVRGRSLFFPIRPCGLATVGVSF